MPKWPGPDSNLQGSTFNRVQPGMTPSIEEKGKYIGSNFAGLSMIKDMVIRPLVIATEKVVEYYFPEDKAGSDFLQS